MFRLVHITDLHIPPLPRMAAGELTIKRILGYLSWRRKRCRQFRREVLEALLTDIRDQNPDHVAVTGDLVNLALDSEFKRSLSVLEKMGLPETVSVIPGNHDAYRKDADAVIKKTWRAYMAGDHEGPGFPYFRRRGNVALIGVSSAVPTPPFIAWGKIDQGQSTRLSQFLAQAHEEGLFSIVLVHHPVTEGVVPWRKALRGAGEFRCVLEAGAPHLILHGHAHKPVKATLLAKGGREIYVCGAAAAVSAGNGLPLAQYHVCEIDKIKTDNIRTGSVGPEFSMKIKHRQYDPVEKKFSQIHEESLQFSAVSPRNRD